MNILITGGSSGLGEAITRRAAQQQGATVYFTYNQSEGNARAIEADHSNTSALKCDFKNDAEVRDLVNLIPQLDIDVLINNAYGGSFIASYFHKTPVDNFATGFNENILPTILLTQAAINVFRKKKSGKIITILTAALVNTPPIGSAVYVANKAYLQQLTKIWATENVKFNITSNTVSPSFMRTGFTAAIDERLVEQMESNHALLQTDEVADGVCFLIDASPRINGIDLIINSGNNIK